MSQPLTVSTITPEQHRDQLRAVAERGGSASFLQTPAWGEVKSEWRRESIGWSRSGSDELVGVGLVLYRQLPRLKRSLAYLPEGPVVDWEAEDLRAWLNPMVRHLKQAGAFGIRMGPPVVTRRWDAAAVKQGIADDAVRRLDDVPPTERSQSGARVVSQLQELGWRHQGAEEGFAAGQPQYNFWVPLAQRRRHGAVRGRRARRDEPAVATQHQEGGEGRASRSASRSASSSTRTSRPSTTSTRTPRSATTSRHGRWRYFTTMFSSLLSEEPDRIRLYLARHEGDLVAATVLVKVGGHTWYSYGASSTEKRDVRGSNAAQWQMIRDALAEGAEVYDLRGITDTLDPDDSHVGLIRFKAGTGGEAVEYAGEWDLPLNPLLYKAFSLYMARR